MQYRLAQLALLFALTILVVSKAFALVETAPQIWGVGQASQASSASASCAIYVPKISPSYAFSSAEVLASGNVANCSATYTSNGASAGVVAQVTSSCPATYSWDSQLKACTKVVTSCPAGTYNDNGVCKPGTACPSAGTNAGGTGGTWSSNGPVPAASNSFCMDSCVVTGSGGRRDSSGVNHISEPISYTGAHCGAGNNGGTDPPTITNPNPEPPPPGMCNGTVNGKTVTVPCNDSAGPPKVDTKNDTKPNPNGGTTTTSTSTSSDTKCTGNLCTTTTTTTTTTTNSNGAAGSQQTGTQTTTSTKDAFCSEHPGDGNCIGTGWTGTAGGVGSGNSGTGTGGTGGGGGPSTPDPTWGGSCAAGFQCTGDAVQCAIAQDQYRRACEFFDTPNALSTIGTTAATGTNPSDHPANAAQTVAIDLASRLSSTPLFGSSGQCPQDVAFTHAGFSFALPFSKWCPYLSLLGAAFLASCYLMAGFIVFRRD